MKLKPRADLRILEQCGNRYLLVGGKAGSR